MWEFLLYFGYGIIEDTLAAGYNKFVQNENAIPAGLTAIAITVFGIYILANIIFEPDMLSAKLIGFAAGNGLGTISVVMYYKRKKKREAQ